MAIRPDYAVGTVNLTLGSKDFTTVGASLESAAVTGGDTIMTADGLVLIIDEVTGQNSGTLLNESPVTVVDAPLVIRFQPDGSKYQGAARDLIGRWGQSGNVDAFAGLTGVVDGVPVFTGAGTMEIQGKDTFVTPDPNGNLVALAGLSDIDNLSELAAIAKQNNQFIVMGVDGSITLKPISDLTDDISGLEQSKFDKPTGSVGQVVLGDGSLAARGLELISSDTNNNPVAAWVKTDLGTTYRELSLFIDAMPVTAGGALNVQVSEDNGATWLSATTDYTEQALVASGTTITALQPQSPGIGSGATASSVGGGGAIMEIKISEFNQFSRSLYSAFITRRTEAGVLELVTRNGLIRPWAPFNAIRLTCSNGNLARFRVVLMGVR